MKNPPARPGFLCGRLGSLALLAACDRTELTPVPDDFNGQWFVQGMYYDMTGPTTTGVIDNVNAYTSASVFSGLQANITTVQGPSPRTCWAWSFPLQTNITTVQGYRTEVLTRNNQQQAAALGQLVTSYGW